MQDELFDATRPPGRGCNGLETEIFIDRHAHRVVDPCNDMLEVDDFIEALKKVIR